MDHYQRVDMDFSHPIYANYHTPLFEEVIKSPPHWSSDKLSYWDDNKLFLAEKFKLAHYYTAQGSINVFRIIGTSHPDYAECSWLELLTKKGKRMDINLPLQEKNPDYYLNTNIKQPTMYFNTFDGLHFYVGIDGNHRSCIARFYLHQLGKTDLHGVTINHYQIDWDFYKLYQTLMALIAQYQLPVQLTVISTHTSRQDSAGWKIDYYSPMLHWKQYQENGEILEEDMLDKSAAQNKLQQIVIEKRSQVDLKTGKSNSPFKATLKTFLQWFKGDVHG
ncbi:MULTISPECIES: hypothetical protein [Gallibacterium]|uniref:hypothetical protein n=1 Tax=Gallibacterium TaxID=155493 RepID=UPI000802756E|nr:MULTISPECIES: hypothetical protein [Gallibacterium]WKS98612.1 hypothetical protein NYR30_07415 [Gallibacterium salpingitidis]